MSLQKLKGVQVKWDMDILEVITRRPLTKFHGFKGVHAWMSSDFCVNNLDVHGWALRGAMRRLVEVVDENANDKSA